jgi:hypothetical protein
MTSITNCTAAVNSAESGWNSLKRISGNKAFLVKGDSKNKQPDHTS